MGRDNLQEMYRILNDIRAGDDATRAAGYMEVRPAYIALLKDASVDFGQLQAYDLDVMNHYALKSSDNIAVDLAIKGVSAVIGTAQAIKETVEFMANPVAITESVTEAIIHYDAVFDQAASVVTHPWDTYKGYTMPQRLALAQQLESAGSEFGLQATQAKAVVNSTINLLSTVAGGVAVAGKIARVTHAPIAREVFTDLPSKVNPLIMGGPLMENEVELPVSDRPKNPHARLTAYDAVMFPEDLATLANDYLKALESAKANDSLLMRQQLQESVSAYSTYFKRINEIVEDSRGAGSQTRESRRYDIGLAGIQQQVVSEKVLLVMTDAPAESAVEQTAKLQMPTANGIKSNLELAIVKSSNAPPFVVVTHPVASAEHTLQGVIGVSYEKISVQQALSMVDHAESVGWATSPKSRPQDFINALQQLAKDQVSSINPVAELRTSTPVIDNPALLEYVGAPDGSRVLLTVNINGMESGKPFTQVAIVLPPQKLANELPNEQPYFVLQNKVSEEPGEGPFIEYRRASPEQIINMTVDPKQIRPEDGVRQMLLKAVHDLASDQISSISPMTELQTFADAVKYFENPEARAVVLQHMTAALKQQGNEQQLT